mgnify:CR=1 FL=1
MSVQAYRKMLIQAVKNGHITQRKAKKMFNLFLEKSLSH